MAGESKRGELDGLEPKETVVRTVPEYEAKRSVTCIRTLHRLSLSVTYVTRLRLFMNNPVVAIETWLMGADFPIRLWS